MLAHNRRTTPTQYGGNKCGAAKEEGGGGGSLVPPEKITTSGDSITSEHIPTGNIPKYQTKPRCTVLIGDVKIQTVNAESTGVLEQHKASHYEMKSRVCGESRVHVCQHGGTSTTRERSCHTKVKL